MKIVRRYSIPVLFTFILILVILIQPRIVYGSSMEPTLNDGQIVLVLRFAQDINRNDIWTCKINGKLSVKRVVGLPGELIEVRDGSIFINGREEEPHFNTPENWYEVLLKEDEYFMAGDNRAHSSDSVLFGPVNAKDIYGKVLLF